MIIPLKYKKHIPSKELRPYIRMLAIVEGPQNETYTILHGTGSVLGFQYKGRQHNGPLAQHTIRQTGIVLVYFRDGGFMPLFHQPVDALQGQRISPGDFILRSELLVLEEQLFEANTDKERFMMTEQFLLARLQRTAPDLLLMTALSIIHKRKGDVQVKELADQLHIKPRSLESRFNRFIGTTAHKFAGIIQMKHMMGQAQDSDTVHEYEKGLYDQHYFMQYAGGWQGGNSAIG